MDFSFFNPIAVLLAALSTFAVGYPWYGAPLFGKAWMREAKVNPDKEKTKSMGKIMGISFVLALIQAALLEMFIGPTHDLAFGIFVGIAVGAGWIGTSIANSYLFEGRSNKLLLINAGYNVVIFTIMAIITTLL